MVIGKFGNRTYLKNILGFTGSFTELKDGRVRLIVCAPDGKKILDKKYKDKKCAYKAWNKCDRIKIE